MWAIVVERNRLNMSNNTRMNIEHKKSLISIIELFLLECTISNKYI